MIKRYLLCELSEGELARIERRLITDNIFFELILAREEQMIDAYVSKRMRRRDRKRFEESYLSTPEGHRQVCLARSLLEYTSRRRSEMACIVRPTGK